MEKKSQHELFMNWRFQAFSKHIIFSFWEFTHSGDHASVFCPWRLLELLCSCDGLNLVNWKLIYSFNTKTKQFITLRCAHQRCNKFIVCSPLVFHTLNLYRTSLYFPPSVFIKHQNVFIIFPTLEAFFSTTNEAINLIFVPMERGYSSCMS